MAELSYCTIKMNNITSWSEVYNKRTNGGEEIEIINLKYFPLGSENDEITPNNYSSILDEQMICNIKEYFFDTNIFLLPRMKLLSESTIAQSLQKQMANDEALALLQYYQIAIKKIDIQKLRRLIDKYSDLEKYFSYLIMIIGYASISRLARNLTIKDTQLSKQKEQLLKISQDVKNLNILFKYIGESYPSPNWEYEELEPDMLDKYSFEKVTIKLRDNQESKIVTLSFNTTIIDTIFYAFKLNLDDMGKSIDEYISSDKPYTKQIVVNQNRPDKLHYAFCQQFFKLFDEQTCFSTKNDYSQNNVLEVFTEIYKISGYKFNKTNDEIDMVRKWLTKPVYVSK